MGMVRTEEHFPRTVKEIMGTYFYKYVLLFERKVNSFYRELKGVLKLRLFGHNNKTG